MWGTFRAAKEGGRAQLLGPIDVLHEFVFVPDVGPVVAKLIREPRAWGSVWHFGGYGLITMRAFAEQIFAQAGRKPKLLVANLWLVRLLGLFNPLMRELVEMHYLLTTPVILNDERLRDLLGGLERPTRMGSRRRSQPCEGGGAANPGHSRVSSGVEPARKPAAD